MRAGTFARVALAVLASSPAFAADHLVGPGRPNAELDTVPWHQLAPGDRVLIDWRAAPYRTKFVLCRQGTPSQPISVIGAPDGSGALPVITGEDALTPSPLNFWNEDRGVIKIGGANTPPDCTPSWIVLENLSIRSARPSFHYTGDDAAVHEYISNAAAVYVEKGQNVTIRGCELLDCGNGLFAASGTTDLVVEGCHIHDNGIETSIYEHNNYSEANGITFQWNHFGPLRANCPGNNLKDRSAGCVIRYNWIEGGNRQLDLVDSGTLNADPKYAATFVYGNVLVEPDGAGNSQIVHYGGDSGTTAQYRKGTLHFFHNTVVSTRVGNTTLFRLSTADEACDCRNNVFYVSETGDRLALMNADGVLNLRNCWFKPGYATSHSGLTGTVNDAGSHVTGAAPGFLDPASQDFRLAETSPCRGAAAAPASGASAHPADRQYAKHRSVVSRPQDGAPDLGAFEFAAPAPPPPPPAGGGRRGGSCGLLGVEALLAAFLLRSARRVAR